jgi:hypothetical protein
MYIYAIEWENPSADKPESVRINNISELEATIKKLQTIQNDKIIKFSIA